LGVPRPGASFTDKPTGPWSWASQGQEPIRPAPYSFGLSATGQQYFSLRTNQPPTNSTFLSEQTNTIHQPPAKRREPGSSSRFLNYIPVIRSFSSPMIHHLPFPSPDDDEGTEGCCLLVRARRAGPGSFLNTVSHLSPPLRPLVSVIAGEPPVLRLRSTSTAPPPRIPRRM
jgi:hypothetical protein